MGFRRLFRTCYAKGCAMTSGELPEDGETQVGPVLLPAGRRIIPGDAAGEPVAWVTVEPLPDVGRIWSALSDLHPVTGMVPALLADDPSQGFLFYGRSEVTGLDRLNAAEVLASLWETTLPGPEDEGEEYAARVRAPFAEQFPGLAPAQDGRLSVARIHEFLTPLPPARLGLVAAGRPADVLALVGWSATDQFQDNLPVAAVLRSWEARFGARLLQIGPRAQLRLLVERPPDGLAAARRIAAEHLAFCDECGGKGLRDVAAISDELVGSPVWSFWWD
jgi:hypothetical protein